MAAHDAQRIGENRIGMLSGLWTGFDVLGFATGSALSALVLAVGRYVSTSGGSGEQPPARSWRSC